ncbi:MAG: hypothetical protein QOF87_3798 [Pseudonocardiales bacterium]|nr:hypothetical protein [Pseudonocardiales bacterium]
MPSRPPAAVSFEIAYVAEDGAERRVPLEESWQVPLESGCPVRRFPARKWQRHLSGLWWSPTMGGHVRYESWLERDHLMALDFDATVTAIVSQPFWLSWSDDDGQRVRHAPDFFARRADGSAVVVDCRSAERRPPRDVAKFDATAVACEALGWEYRLLGATDPVVTANLRWLAGYRHPRHRLPAIAEALMSVVTGPTPLMVAAEQVGDPLAVLPVLFHLLWCQELGVDLWMPLHDRVMVRVGGGGR